MNKKSNVLIIIGLLLIAVALSFTLYNLYDERRAEVSVQNILEVLPTPRPTSMIGDGDLKEEEISDYRLNPNMDMPSEIVDGKDYIGILQIPALHLTLPIISEWSYPNLKMAPCRYTGSVYLDNMVIAAHNYASHFGTIKNLKVGDRMYYTDADGNVFTYSVVETEVLKHNAVEAMTSGNWDLTLFTCTWSGQNHVTVRCEKIED